jgi:hypothetical protein
MFLLQTSDDHRSGISGYDGGMFHYGYFVRLPESKLAPAGDSWSPTRDTYKVGDSLGVRNGAEGIVIDVIKPAGKQQHFDVLVVVEQRDANLAGTKPQTRAVVPTFMGSPPPLPSPPTIQTPWVERNQRVVAIWNTVVFRPLTETFHEFLVEVPFKGTLGKAWYKSGKAKHESKQHVLIHWLEALRLQQVQHRPANHQAGQVFGAPASGETIALIALAHDLYLLQKVNRLPKKLVNRLRNYDEFQGARYEIAIAAAFVRCGFEIEWITDSAGRHPEFIARNRHTGEEVSVETKSRHRRGVLNQPGTQATQFAADIDQLYTDAVGQNPQDRPFAIFIDVNVPPVVEQGQLADWQGEILARWTGDQSISLIGFTNFSWHYQKDEQLLPRAREYFLAAPKDSERPLKTPETIECLQIAFDTYGVCPNEY